LDIDQQDKPDDDQPVVTPAQLKAIALRTQRRRRRRNAQQPDTPEDQQP